MASAVPVLRSSATPATPSRITASRPAIANCVTAPVIDCRGLRPSGLRRNRASSLIGAARAERAPLRRGLRELPPTGTIVSVRAYCAHEQFVQLSHVALRAGRAPTG